MLQAKGARSPAKEISVVGYGHCSLYLPYCYSLVNSIHLAKLSRHLLCWRLAMQLAVRATLALTICSSSLGRIKNWASYLILSVSSRSSKLKHIHIKVISLIAFVDPYCIEMWRAFISYFNRVSYLISCITTTRKENSFVYVELAPKILGISQQCKVVWT